MKSRHKTIATVSSKGILVIKFRTSYGRLHLLDIDASSDDDVVSASTRTLQGTSRGATLAEATTLGRRPGIGIMNRQTESADTPAKRRHREELSAASDAEKPKVAKVPRLDRKSPLCEVCYNINFAALFGSPSNVVERPLPTLRKALSNLKCAMCILIVKFANDFVSVRRGRFYAELTQRVAAILAKEDSRDIGVYLKSGTDGEMYLMSTSVNRFTQVYVWLYLVAIDGSKEEWAPNKGAMQTKVAALEAYEAHDHCFGLKELHRSLTYTMRQRPIPSLFKPETLSSWLEHSGEMVHGKKTGQTKRHALALNDLIALQKFHLLDVRNGQVVQASEDHRYVALSYTWGDAVKRYLASCKPARGEGIDIARLPASLRDAVGLAAAIGQRYLWVDALCIDQDDPADVHANIGHMAAIYQNAMLTIVAADGHGADSGLSRLSSVNLKPFQPICLETAQGQLSLVISLDSIDQTIKKTMWSSRGWTMQERFLSELCVFFTPNEVLFRGRGFEAREAYELVAHAHHGHNATQRSGRRRRTRLEDRLVAARAIAARDYDEIVNEFTSRSLSHPGDRLDAFAGLIPYIHRSREAGRHDRSPLAGLPEPSFLLSLAWFHKSPGERPARIRMNARGTQLLPSWSWVGWEGQCSMPNLYVLADGRWSEGKVEIVDAANVVCISTHGPLGKIEASMLPEPADRRPDLLPVSMPLKTVLHLFALTSACRVTWLDVDDDAYNISIMGPTGAEHHRMRGKPSQIAVPTKGRDHRLIMPLPVWKSFDMLLVERDGDFYSRLGWVSLETDFDVEPDSSAWEDCFRPEWTKVL